MTNSLILAIDQGTTNTKAILVDKQGRILRRASRSTGITYPQPAWVEQNPAELWDTVRQVIDECLELDVDHHVIVLAITNQRETVMAWDRDTGKPLGPAVVWQCQRSADFCRQLEERGHEKFLRERTGLTIDPMFSGSKMRWLLDHIQDGHKRAEAGKICLGTVDCWVLWNLTQGARFACDYTNASRTQLFNLHKLNWDDEILELFDIPKIALPQPCLSNSIFGETIPIGRLPGGLPIASLIGDSHAALYGHAGFTPGAVKATYGTGTSLMSPIDSPILSDNGLSTTIAWGTREKTTYALEGNIYISGAVVQWLGKILGLSDATSEIEKMAALAEDTQGVYLVPAFVGLGAPYWDMDARGLISGLTSGSNQNHLARAALESIAYQVRDIFDIMSDETGVPLEFLFADGGASRNDILMQFQADIIGRPVIRNLSADLSALGAAYLAGQAVGIWPSDEAILELERPQEHFESKLPLEERDTLYSGWKHAIRQVLMK